MFRQVPVLPVVVPLATMLLAGLLWPLSRTGRLSVSRAAVALALCVYVAGVVAHTVFPIFLDKPASSGPWSSHLVLVPFVGYEVADAVMNILVFVPVGILVPLVLGTASWGSTIVAAGVFSLTIEAAQLLTAHLLGGGHVADVNDLVFNVAGGAVGYALFRAVAQVPFVDDLVERFRWRPTRPAAQTGGTAGGAPWSSSTL